MEQIDRYSIPLEFAQKQIEHYEKCSCTDDCCIDLEIKFEGSKGSTVFNMPVDCNFPKYTISFKEIYKIVNEYFKSFVDHNFKIEG